MYWLYSLRSSWDKGFASLKLERAGPKHESEDSGLSGMFESTRKESTKPGNVLDKKKDGYIGQRVRG